MNPRTTRRTATKPKSPPRPERGSTFLFLRLWGKIRGTPARAVRAHVVRTALDVRTPSSRARHMNRRMQAIRPHLLLLLTAFAIASCARVAAPPGAAPASDVADAPALQPGTPDAEADREAARLLAEGEARLEADDASGARAVAADVEQRLARARGSSRALWLRARAEGRLGEWAAAERAATAYLDVVSTEDPFRPAALLLRAEMRLEGDLGGGVEALFDVPGGAPQDVRDATLERARRVATALNDPVLRDLVAEAPRHPWLLPVFQVELGVRRALVGDRVAARNLGGDALALEPAGPEAERARALRAGEEVARGEVSGILGAILSPSGSPTVEQLSQEIREGIEVALLEEGVRGGVSLRTEDDAGVASGAASALRRLEDGRVLGVIGPLTDSGVAAALEARTSPAPLLSPTARTVPAGTDGVFLLTGVDPEASRALARLARMEGIRDVVVLHRADREEEQEAAWFREAFEASGGRVVRTLSFAPGRTSFDGPLREVAGIRPQGLVLFVPPESAELLAPQMAYLREDEFGIVMLGGASWGSDAVLRALPAARTDGILTVVPHVGDGFGPGWDRFVGMYEEHFRRTLRSPVPALGYDAAMLLLEAARRGGATSPAEVRRGLESIQGYPGATGTFSVVDGRLVRVYHPVRIQNRTRVPMAR